MVCICCYQVQVAAINIQLLKMMCMFFHSNAVQYFFLFRGSVVSHYQDQTLVGFLGMQHLSFLEDGWAWVLCFPFVVGILNLVPLITSHGLLVKRYVHLTLIYHLFIDADVI